MHLLLKDLKAFVRRASVIELGVAFALATTGVGLISTLVNSLIVFPVDNSTSSGLFSGQSSGTFTIAHRLFNYEDVLFELLTVALVVVGAALVVRLSGETVFNDDDVRDCPHCLSEIPTAASVCSFCTREVDRAAE